MGSPRRIIVMDDNGEIAELVCAVAAGLAFECIAPASVRALLATPVAEPDLILLDMRLPEMDGTQVLGLLGRAGCRSGIVLMSGVGRNALQQAEQVGRDAGLRMAGLLLKPFRVAELKAILGTPDTAPVR